MIDKNILAGFGGSEQWHKWSPLFPNVTLTDGAKYIADNGGQSGAYWLMDAIASQIEEAKKANEMCRSTRPCSPASRIRGWTRS
jgi:hypothetical protein